jgi:hypothetical protein
MYLITLFDFLMTYAVYFDIRDFDPSPVVRRVGDALEIANFLASLYIISRWYQSLRANRQLDLLFYISMVANADLPQPPVSWVILVCCMPSECMLTEAW